MQQPIEIKIENEQRLDLAVVAATGRTRGQASSAVKDGAVYVDGKRCREPGIRLQIGQLVRIEPAAPAARRHIDGGQVRVVHRDDRVLIVDKPAGLPTQPPPRGGDALSLRVKALIGKLNYLGEVHRLDRDASGLVAYALDREAAGALADQFKAHTAGRRYLAIVRMFQPPVAMTIEEPIAEVEPGRMTVRADGIPATTHVVPLGWDEARKLALLDVTIATGRSHQIRVHLAWAIGPIWGDAMYGDPDGAQVGRIALHGAQLQLRHPGDGRHKTWTALPPEGFWPTDTTLPRPDWA